MKSVVTLLSLMVLVLAGCASPAVPPTPPDADVAPTPGSTTPPSTSEPAPELQLALTVLGTPFTLADLKVLPQAQVAVDGQTYQGIQLLDLLSAAELTNVVSVTLVSREALTVEVGVADLGADSLLVFSPDELFDALLPGAQELRWLRDVVVVEPSPGGRAALRVGETLLTWPEVRSLEQVKVKVGTRAYTGVRLADVLDAAGAQDARSITLVGRDGETLDVAVADLGVQTILALDEPDRLDAVLPAVDKDLWPEDVFDIRLTP